MEDLLMQHVLVEDFLVQQMLEEDDLLMQQEVVMLNNLLIQQLVVMKLLKQQHVGQTEDQPGVFVLVGDHGFYGLDPCSVDTGDDDKEVGYVGEQLLFFQVGTQGEAKLFRCCILH